MAVHQPQRTQCGVGVACHGCGRRLPLRLADVHEEASLWECVQCQTPVAGVLSADILRMLARRIRLAPLHFDTENAEPLSEAVLQVVAQNASSLACDLLHDTRRSRRMYGHREVVTLCLDDRYCIAGPPINGVVANLSRHGLMLVTTTQVTAPAVVTQFQGSRNAIQLVGRVVWSSYLDIGCYGAGVDFIARLGAGSM